MMTIDPCNVTSGCYIRHLCALFIADNWFWMALPVAVCAVLAFWIDVRFVIVALMVLFIVLPMVLALIYFYYGLSPEARWSVMEKSLVVDDATITLSFTDERMKKHVIRWDDVHDIIEKDDALLLMLSGGRRYTCLMLPASMIEPDIAQSFRKFVAQAH